MSESPYETNVFEDFGMDRVYLAGPMTGYKDFNFPAFHQAAAVLKKQFNLAVWSPAADDLNEGFDPSKDEAKPLAVYMAKDLPRVCEADGVVVLPGWKTSRGASIEVAVALGLHKPVVRYFDLTLVTPDDAGSDDYSWPDGDPLAFEEVVDFVPDGELLGTLPPESVAGEADRIVSTERGADYGHPLDDFGKVSGMAMALWGRGPETPEEHALYMILIKVSREANKHKRDNLVDICGYAKTLEMVVEERQRREELEAGREDILAMILGAFAPGDPEGERDVPACDCEECECK